MTQSISSLKRRAKKIAYRFYRSNWRKDSIDNHGGYMVVDVSTNTVIDGSRFDCTLEEVAYQIELQETRLAG